MEDSKRKISLKCARFSLDAISVLQLIIAILMMIGATSIKILFREYHFINYYPSLHNLPNLWIATGCFLIVFSIFGIFATIKNSTMMLNLYAMLLTFVFILQMSAAITGFATLPQTGAIVQSTISSVMNNYSENERYRSTMDWIQNNFKCCGNEAHSDWYPITSPLPESCCVDQYYYCVPHKRGCHSVLYDMIFRSILLIASAALLIGMLQVWGIICSFAMASKVRQSKTQRDVERWSAIRNAVLDESAILKVKPEEQKE